MPIKSEKNDLAKLSKNRSYFWINNVSLNDMVIPKSVKWIYPDEMSSTSFIFEFLGQ